MPLGQRSLTGDPQQGDERNVCRRGADGFAEIPALEEDLLHAALSEVPAREACGQVPQPNVARGFAGGRNLAARRITFLFGGCSIDHNVREQSLGRGKVH